MARTSVTLKMPTNAIGKDYNISIAGGTYLQFSDSAGTSATDEYTISSHNFTLPSIDLSKSFIATSFKIPLQINITKPETDSVSFAVYIGDTQYYIDSEGNVTDSGFIAYLNDYIVLNCATPPMNLTSESRILKPTSGHSYVSILISPPLLTGTLEGGGTSIYRPVADISAGHEIPNGFSGVYQLLNEAVPDDDASYISSFDEARDTDEPESPTEKTSKVDIGFSLPRRTNLIQLRPVVRALLKGTKSAFVDVDSAQTIITVSVGDASESFIAEFFDHTNQSFIDNAVYNTFEGAFDYDSPVVEAINSYYSRYNEAPLVEVSVYTRASGSEKSGYKEGYSADCRVTQVYLEAVYEEKQGMNMYRHNGSTWKQVQVTYQKQNGVWVEITEHECKSILSNASVVIKN